MKCKILLFILLLICFRSYGKDLYNNFNDLMSSEIRDLDFRITYNDFNKSLGVFAIHGGKIEPGTSELAKLISNGTMNEYFFEGIKESNNFSLHITSTNFDEPNALRIASKSVNCLSIHGYIGNGTDAICIGGGNIELANKFSKILKLNTSNIDIIYPCVDYPGASPSNIVNKCQNQGIQLEFSQSIREKLLATPQLLINLSRILRATYYESLTK